VQFVSASPSPHLLAEEVDAIPQRTLFLHLLTEYDAWCDGTKHPNSVSWQICWLSGCWVMWRRSAARPNAILLQPLQSNEGAGVPFECFKCQLNKTCWTEKWLALMVKAKRLKVFKYFYLSLVYALKLHYKRLWKELISLQAQKNTLFEADDIFSTVTKKVFTKIQRLGHWLVISGSAQAQNLREPSRNLYQVSKWDWEKILLPLPQQRGAGFTKLTTHLEKCMT